VLATVLPVVLATVLASAPRAHSVWRWSFDLSLILLIDIAVLYWSGGRRAVVFAYVHRWLVPPAPDATRAPRLAS
jgi:hypothetical protein